MQKLKEYCLHELFPGNLLEMFWMETNREMKTLGLIINVKLTAAFGDKTKLGYITALIRLINYNFEK